jgi:alkylation response protein AidB-like acyl-CoA dehydrogenase
MQKAYSCSEADRVQPTTGSAAAHNTINHNCEVPAANLLGKECLEMVVFSPCMEWERGLILASAIGSMESRKSA